MDLDEPIDKRRPDGLLDLLLACHVGGVWVPLGLRPQHVPVDLLAILRDVVDVVQRGLVNAGNVRKDLILASLVEHLQLLMEADSGQFLPRASASGSQLPQVVADTADLVRVAASPLAIPALSWSLDVLGAALDNWRMILVESWSNLAHGPCWLLGVASHAVVIIRYYRLVRSLFLHKTIEFGSKTYLRHVIVQLRGVLVVAVAAGRRLPRNNSLNRLGLLAV
jgi:hypothetical protein